MVLSPRGEPCLVPGHEVQWKGRECSLLWLERFAKYSLIGSVQVHKKSYVNGKSQLLFIPWVFFFSDCEATFKGRFKLREHLRSHTQEKIVACPTCGGMFANNTKFFDHIRRQTTIEGMGRNLDHLISIHVLN